MFNWIGCISSLLSEYSILYNVRLTNYAYNDCCIDYPYTRAHWQKTSQHQSYMYTRLHMYDHSMTENALFPVHRLGYPSISDRFSIRFHVITAKFRIDFPSFKGFFFIEQILAPVHMPTQYTCIVEVRNSNCLCMI